MRQFWHDSVSKIYIIICLKKDKQKIDYPLNP